MSSSALKHKPVNDSETVIQEIAKIAKELTGVQLTDRHSSMISSRLQKRLGQLKLASFHDYLTYLKKNWESESQVLIGTLTTHHTYFFREFAHFEFITSKALAFLVPLVLARADRTLRIWSAASSRGQEVYSLAMLIQSALTKQFPEDSAKIKIDILGTDIDAESVAIAKNGVYPWSEVKEIPLNFLSSNWVRGSGDISNFAKAKTHLRAPCRFEQQNLLALKLKNEKPFDLIFCRNVFIYFDPAQIQAITNDLLKNINPEGFLFLGISESLHGMPLPVKTVGPSIYVRNTHSWLKEKTAAASKTAVITAPVPEKPIRVLVVDDSPSIHTLMKQVFTAQYGFEIVGHAMNGIEASEMLKTKQVDALTLDIHMPVQDGVEYLRTNFNSNHPPVVMVSSVSREDSSLATQALEIGASDYVEKPALNNLKQRADELRTKIRCSVRAKQNGARDLKLDKSFQTTSIITDPENKLRVLVMQGADRERVGRMLKTLVSSNQPPCVLFLDSGLQGAELVKNQFEKEIGMRLKSEEDLLAQGPKKGEVYVVFHSQTIKTTLQKIYAQKSAVTLVCGEVSEEASVLFHGLKSVLGSGVKWNLVLEELGDRNAKNVLFDIATEFSPLSGFAYLSEKYFNQK